MDENYIKKWLEGTMNKEEESAFKKTEDYKSLKKLLEATQAFKAPSYNVEDELARVRQRKSHGNGGKLVRVNWMKPLLQVAAVLLITAGAYFFFLHAPEKTTQTLAGEKTELFLPDSSFVVLNASSKIAYVESTWGKKRKLELEGEAFFKVAKGSKFDVNTSLGTVSVLGTQFNVKQRKDYFEVTCYEGLVQVEVDTEKVQLPANHSFRIVDGQIAKFDDLTVSSPGWISEESYFHSVPFIQVIREFERQYNVTITIENADDNQLFTGGFTQKDITLALRSITLPLNLTFRVVDSRHVILYGDSK